MGLLSEKHFFAIVLAKEFRKGKKTYAPERTFTLHRRQEFENVKNHLEKIVSTFFFGKCTEGNYPN